jgi:AraC family transcriptional regulator of adaptative response/methylated-DNA-[protein]-cysteine methyltransferase
MSPLNISKLKAGDSARPAADFSSDDARWNAVCRRDPAAVGAFVCCVQTTGIYCLPSCGARQPRRENVRFYATCAEAEQAGFRACKRCRSNEALRADRHLGIKRGPAA